MEGFSDKTTTKTTTLSSTKSTTATTTNISQRSNSELGPAQPLVVKHCNKSATTTAHVAVYPDHKVQTRGKYKNILIGVLQLSSDLMMICDLPQYMGCCHKITIT